MIIKRSTAKFEWMFLVKGKTDSAVQFVTKQFQHRLIGCFLTIIVATLFDYLPSAIGVNEESEHVQDMLAFVTEKTESGLRGTLRMM